MLKTPKLQLNKPEGTDVVNIEDLNANMDKLDAEVTRLASASQDGRMSRDDKVRLNGIAPGANNYVHPATHPASMITETTTERFVSDAEKLKWNGKQDSLPAENRRKISIQSTAPTNPSENDIWIEV